jgi:hypothetical protein
MKDKKPWRALLKDSFTKTRGQIYEESTKKERIVYWISIALACLAILLLGRW